MAISALPTPATTGMTTRKLSDAVIRCMNYN
jgi:hypothetical protein